MKHQIRYGKADVKVYRTFAEPLTGVTPIPESPFTGRENRLAAAEIEVVVHGTQFLDAYTKGDNRLVVATDTMKNFIHAASLSARARTLEEWLHEVGTAFLDTYPHMERLTMLGRDLPFPAALVPAADGDGFEASDRLFSRDRCDYGSGRLDLARKEFAEAGGETHAAYNMGIVLMAQSRYSEAAGEFETARFADPSLGDAVRRARDARLLARKEHSVGGEE